MNTALHSPFEVNITDLEHWSERPLVHHFFEIVQVLEGAGTRELNRNRIPYQEGHIFLYTPLDCRGFHSDVPTKICSIRFSEVFLGQQRSAAEKERIFQWLKQLEHIFYYHNRFEEVMITHKGDCKMIKSLIGNLLEEYNRRDAFYEENSQYLVTLILNIITRNVAATAEQLLPQASTAREPLISSMLQHIRQHIQDPEQLRIDHLAGVFNLSSNYVSEYFRKFTGESVQQYITQYKIKMVGQRLTHSKLTLSQIADELGFTDESHLSRQFRKYQGVSPAAFRKATAKHPVA
ncbi:helix-turn-helix domain-containing protein [Chitinophaga sp. Hz27]|uniref:helix-turn-helix domain-containing protein n=1 Tax=Chitinophaga sp. Hz27 TaxID=3347169 RepID=UPI0035DA7918